MNMRDGATPVVVQRAEYAPPPFRIRSVELNFDLDPAKTIVASKLQIERDPAAATGQPLRLNGEDLTLLRVLAGEEPPGAGDVDALLATLAEALDRQASADRAVDSTVASLYQISKGPYLLRGRSVAIMMGRNKKPVLKFPKAPLGGK
jgi:aminopeptidase N